MTTWYPPETAPTDGTAFLITTAGPQIDICCWVEARGRFEDYFHKQNIAPMWPYMIGWAPLPEPAAIKNSEHATRVANGWSV